MIHHLRSSELGYKTKPYVVNCAVIRLDCAFSGPPCAQELSQADKEMKGHICFDDINPIFFETFEATRHQNLVFQC